MRLEQPPLHRRIAVATSFDTTIEVALGESIQHAIDNIADGGTINLAAGTFNENLTIDKPISLVGAIDGDGDSATTITVTTGNAITINTSVNIGENVSISNVSLDGSGAANTGVRVGTGVVGGTLTYSNGSVTGFRTHGVGVFGNSSTGLSVQNVELSGLDFSNNGIGGGGGAGDIQFFNYNGNASLTDLALVGSATATTGARLGIQFRGVGGGDGTGVTAIGTVSLTNIDCLWQLSHPAAWHSALQ